MRNIEKGFLKLGKQMNINQFCKIMLENLDYDVKNKDLLVEVALSLIDLFKEIDVNGDCIDITRCFINFRENGVAGVLRPHH